MRGILFAAALAAASLPAQAAVWEFTGQCSSRTWYDGSDLSTLPCAPVRAAVTVPDWYEPGTTLYWNSAASYEEQNLVTFSFYDSRLTYTDIVAHESYDLVLPDRAGPGYLVAWMGFGVLAISPDGTWSHTAEIHTPTPWYRIEGFGGTFTRISAVPLPGTLALLGAGALLMRRRRD